MELVRGKDPIDILFISIIIIVILAAVSVHFFINEKDNSNFNPGKSNDGESQNTYTNPSSGTGGTQTGTGGTQTNIPSAPKNYTDKELIKYMGTYLKLSELHNIFLTSNTPKIQVYVGDKSYFIEIVKGSIIVNDGTPSNPDLIIRTTYEELSKMRTDSNYLKESLYWDKTTIEVVAGNVVLVAKGYLNLYNELEGSFAGSVIKKFRVFPFN